MKTPKKLQFVIVGVPKSKTWIPVACSTNQTDMLFRAVTGFSPAGEFLAPLLPKVRFQIQLLPPHAQINVLQGSDLVAEAAIGCPDYDLFLDLLGDEPAHSTIEDLQFRSNVRKAHLALQPPACLMVWKSIASHRLTIVEHQIVIEEI